MLKSVEVIGKNKDDVIKDALNQLNVTIDEVEIEILEEGTKGFLGIGSKPFKIRVSKKSDPIKTAKDFLRQVFIAIGISVDIECELIDKKQLKINLSGDNMGVIIGKRGQTLDALQYITSIMVNKLEDSYINVLIDTELYRNKRKDTLEKLAFGLAKKAKHLRKDVVLEPMNANERKIIHSTLQNDRYVTTHSEGEEPFRYVVIAIKEEYKEFKPKSGYNKGGFKSGYKNGYKTKNYKNSFNSDYKSDYKAGGYNKKSYEPEKREFSFTYDLTSKKDDE